MLLSFRVGRASRPSASFIRLAKYRAHRPQDTPISFARWRTYTTESVGSVHDSAQEPVQVSAKVEDQLSM